MMIIYKYDYGDSIAYNSIIGRAGSIHKKRSKKKDSLILKVLSFFQSAECIKNIPITAMRKTKKQNVEAEGLRGHKIYGESEDYSRFKKVKVTARHTQWQTILRNNAFCVINIPIRSRR